jgi:hypothetical protein
MGNFMGRRCMYILTKKLGDGDEGLGLKLMSALCMSRNEGCVRWKYHQLMTPPSLR